MRLRVIVPVLFVVAATAGAYALSRVESIGDTHVVLAGGLALAAFTGALVATSDRRRRAIREVERYFTLAPEMVVTAGFDGRWKRVNPAVEAVLGYTEAEALARPFMELIHPDDRERSSDEVGRVIAGATSYAFENRMLCKDGMYKVIEWTATPVAEERVIYGIGRDVTERRRSESEEIALRRLATLVAEGLPASEIFSAVSEEVGRLFGSDLTVVARFDPDGPATVVMGVAKDVKGMPVGSRWELEDGLAAARVHRTGGPVRIDAVDWEDLHTPIGAVARRVGVVSTVSCPIHVGGRLWGTITVPAKEPLPPDTEARLEKFTGLIATAIANAESHEAIARLAEEQAALRRVATLVARGAPSGEVFEAVATEAGRLFDTDITIVGRYDDDGMATAIGNWSASPGGVPVGTRSAIGGHNLLTMVAETGAPARMDGYEDASGEAAEIARRHGWRSSIAAPIVVEGRLWGVMLVATQRPEAFPTGAEVRLAAFTDLVATAVANAQAHDEVLQFGDEQATLRRIATLVAEGLQPEEIFAAVMDETWRALETDAVGMLRFESDGTATLVAQSQTPWDPPPLGTSFTLDGENVITEVHSTGLTARVDDWSTATGSVAAMASVLGVRSAVANPIVVEGRLWGTIIAATSQNEPLPRYTESRIEQFTELVATAVANAEARQGLERVAAEQAALRRVATVVARGVTPEGVFHAVAAEAGELFGADVSAIVRFEDDGTATVLGDVGGPHRPGTRVTLDPGYVVHEVRETGRPARFDTEDPSTADIGSLVKSFGVRSAVASPIVAEGELWGAITAVSVHGPLAPGAEQRLTDFTELVATAVANTEAREEVTALAEEQAALRRVATLVAQGASPRDLIEAVAEEVGHLLPVASATIGRFEADDSVTTMASWSAAEVAFPTGRRWPTEGTNVAWLVLQSGKAGRIDDFSAATDPIGVAAREAGYTSAVGSPIVVEGRLWGVITTTSSEGPLPPGTEERLASFTELVGTAIANAKSSAELAASRRRIVAASDQTRRRIERNLHDGTQQRLVSLGLAVRAAEANLPPDRDDLRAQLSGVAMGLADAVDDLQEISRGIHPAILSKGGLGPALKALAYRSAIPVDLDITTEVRLAEPIEVAAYFVASEALANAAKHSQASRVDLSLARDNGGLVLSVRDDGVGGADAGRGSGLVGLTDRVEALGGSIRVSSRPGEGTQITTLLPLELESQPAR